MVAKRKPSETTLTTPLPPLLTRRSALLAINGPGPRPCLDGARNWLGCTGRADDLCSKTGLRCCLAAISIEDRMQEARAARELRELRRQRDDASLEELREAERRPRKRFVTAWAATRRVNR